MLTKNKSFILLFILFSIITAYFIITSNNYLAYFSRVISILFIAAYYLSSTKRKNNIFIIFIVLAISSSGIFSIEHSHFLGFVALLVSRILFLYLIIKIPSKREIKGLLTILIPFVITSSIIFVLTYRNNLRFYLMMVTGVITIIIASILFYKLLKTLKRGNLELFLGIFSFIFCDTLFVVQGLKLPYNSHILIILAFYQLGYYLLCRGMIIS